MAKEITPRAENYAQWYLDIVKKADLADNSAVRGCMVIKPRGYAIWEKIQGQLDKMFKETGHVNAYFPLFIPKSFLSKEAEHVEGFAKECAVVTHHRLMKDPNGKGVIVDPDALLEEELIVRPTSETIIWNTYKDWIQSYRDLPLLINQWANVVRWELRTRPFLRTTEFLWQEGHTAHATSKEAIEEAELIHEIYTRFVEDFLAIPIIKGKKTASERFAGAVDTYTIEALMQDKKALQAGTSHFLGQNFAKAFDVTYLNEKNQSEFVWATSWGVSTRLIGALIMTHSDDEGLVLPPKMAPLQVIIVPIPKPTPAINEVSDKIIAGLKAKGITVNYDLDEKNRPGFKFAQNEMRGIPVRIGIGQRDLDQNQVEIARRDTKEKVMVPVDGVIDYVVHLLDQMQQDLFQKAKKFRSDNSHYVDTYDEFKQMIEEPGGFFYCHWDGTAETEARIKEETKATIRCIPLDQPIENGKCMVTGAPSTGRVIIAKAY
ncbi:MAG: proline--tRNA ligase [Saprospiraceae bacterium]|jgi:prolyl-tRNA synthetase|nr:proline--tRNA ligase [Saprospiraceae bacterium]MBK6480778.1 proline--tRNA ligase [Saprospiraceae bacterium]MBK6816864.1 proline--tRNA ligase [Saprospiraceae bacterium]MBK7371392.1 proline--tRNA ligase [Saprospiraceae bacterium]MBK8281457.1 proline--tRNA ligase [Saprospiraceae bacterium]